MMGGPWGGDGNEMGYGAPACRCCARLVLRGRGSGRGSGSGRALFQAGVGWRGGHWQRAAQRPPFIAGASQ